MYTALFNKNWSLAYLRIQTYTHVGYCTNSIAIRNFFSSSLLNSFKSGPFLKSTCRTLRLLRELEGQCA